MSADTKNLISDCFIEMTKKKSIDKITVTDLVESCSISRQTFYYHFRDILDVMEYRVSQAIERTLAATINEDSPQKAIDIFVSAVSEHNDILQAVLSSQRHGEFEKMMMNGIKGYLREMFRHRSPDTAVSHFESEATLHFYSCGIIGLLLEYGGKCKDTKKLSELIYSLLMENQ